MKFILFLGALALLICLALAQPEAADLEVLPLESSLSMLQDDDIPNVHSRHKRLTCDLLTIWKVNHSACAAACIYKRKEGGYCNGFGKCICRE